MQDLIQIWLQEIHSAKANRSSSVCSRICDELSDALLNYDFFPDDLFDFVLILLSSRDYSEKPGIWNFILVVNNARDELSLDQKKRFLDTVVRGYGDYADGDLCFAICDYIARNLPSHEARSILLSLKEKEFEKDEKIRGCADQGIFIVDQEMKRNGESPRQ